MQKFNITNKKLGSSVIKPTQKVISKPLSPMQYDYKILIESFLKNIYITVSY